MNIYMDNIYIIYGYINIWFVGDFSTTILYVRTQNEIAHIRKFYQLVS